MPSRGFGALIALPIFLLEISGNSLGENRKGN
jgi:hypothetical protein